MAVVTPEKDKRKYYANRTEEQIRATRRYQCEIMRQRRKDGKIGWSAKKLLAKALSRARRRGMDATVQLEDISFPEKCPVLGILLDYTTPVGHRKQKDHSPSLDRLDNSKGYVPGNVVVISLRANLLKKDATLFELEKLVNYMKYGELCDVL
jgi:hypothetical protein